MIMIRKANFTDITEIMKIIKETIIEMHSYGNTQWDENYPQEKDFLKDIQKMIFMYVNEKKI